MTNAVKFDGVGQLVIHIIRVNEVNEFALQMDGRHGLEI